MVGGIVVIVVECCFTISCFSLSLFEAFSALRQVARIVCKVIIMELFLILAFSAMACHLYFEYQPFHNLLSSFLSLFESKYEFNGFNGFIHFNM